MEHNDLFGGSSPVHNPEPVDVTGSELVSLPDNDHAADVDRETLKTGTTTIGISADEGVVLLTDTRASLGHMVSSKAAQKVEQIHPRAAMTISGSVSAAQNLISTIQAESRLYRTRRDKEMSMKALSTLLGNLLRSGAFLVVVPVLGGVDDDGAHVYSFDALGGTIEEDYAVSGSGSQFALGVLENHYEEGISMEEAESIGRNALISATERDTASGNGVHIARITEDGVEIEEYDSVDEIR